MSKRAFYSDPGQKYFVIDGHLKKYLQESMRPVKGAESAHNQSYKMDYADKDD